MISKKKKINCEIKKYTKDLVKQKNKLEQENKQRFDESKQQLIDNIQKKIDDIQKEIDELIKKNSSYIKIIGFIKIDENCCNDFSKVKNCCFEQKKAFNNNKTKNPIEIIKTNNKYKNDKYYCNTINMINCLFSCIQQANYICNGLKEDTSFIVVNDELNKEEENFKIKCINLINNIVNTANNDNEFASVNNEFNFRICYKKNNIIKHLVSGSIFSAVSEYCPMIEIADYICTRIIRYIKAPSKDDLLFYDNSELITYNNLNTAYKSIKYEFNFSKPEKNTNLKTQHYPTNEIQNADVQDDEIPFDF